MEKTKLEVCKKCWGTGHVHGGNENSTWSKSCEECHGAGFIRVSITNADHIRAMSDEELAKVLNAFTAYFDECNRGIADIDCHDCELCELCSLGEGKAIKWLKQPAEDL